MARMSHWPKKSITVTAHWAALDGQPIDWPVSTTTNDTEIVADGNYVFQAPYRSPDYAGRYVVTFTATHTQNAPSESKRKGAHSGQEPLSDLPVLGNLTGQANVPIATLSVQVWVVPDSSAVTIPVDLTTQFNDRGIAAEGDTVGGGIDGKGNAIPAEQIPPDGTRELTGNPFVIGKPGPAYYPAGFYIGSGGIENFITTDVTQSISTDHLISFIYADKGGKDMIGGGGQTIAIPEGAYKSIHILAAAASSSTLDATFRLVGPGTSQTQHTSIQSWNAPPTSTSDVGWIAGYHLNAGVVDTTSPSVLGHYTIPADATKRINALVLPNDPRVKVFAITLER